LVKETAGKIHGFTERPVTEESTSASRHSIGGTLGSRVKEGKKILYQKKKGGGSPRVERRKRSTRGGGVLPPRSGGEVRGQIIAEGDREVASLEKKRLGS